MVCRSAGAVSLLLGALLGAGCGRIGYDRTRADGGIPGGPDATACVAGASCDDGNPCHTGVVECSTGAPVCAGVRTLPAGAPCGAGLVCDDSGACSVHVDGGGLDAGPADGGAGGGMDAGGGTDAGGRVDAGGGMDAGGAGDGGAADAAAPDAGCTSGSCTGAPVRLFAGPSLHTCALYRPVPASPFVVKCWGDNASGQLGLGDTSHRGDAPGEMGAALPVVDVDPSATVTELAVGQDHTCARLGDGRVKCWGENADGQLGLGDTNDRGDGPGEMGAALPQVDLGTGRTAVEIVAGFAHTCARLDDGSVKCWGANLQGQLGLGDTRARGDAAGEMGDRLLPVALGTGRTAVQITAGGQHTCALLDDRRTVCWGYGVYGQLGVGDPASRGDGPGEMGDALVPVDLGPGRSATRVVANAIATCALLDDGSIRCWGGNFDGQLGLGDTTFHGDGPGEMGAALPPVDVVAGRTVARIESHGFHVCVVYGDASMRCWGANYWGELGLGDGESRGDEPGEVGASLPFADLGTTSAVAEVATGNAHTCVGFADGMVKCWGGNALGSLGLGDVEPRGDGPGEMGAALPPVAL